MSEVCAPAGQRSGIILSTEHGSDKSTTQDTVRCCHCGKQWVWMKGSGRRRGFCLRCNGVTCGGTQCDGCVPLEQQLDNIESGRRLDYRPIIAAVPRSVG